MSVHDDELLEVIVEFLNVRRRAEKIIRRYYRDKITIVWRTMDVHRAANERELALTEREAMTVLETLHIQHNKQYGIRWEDLTTYIEDNVLGRKLTKAEISKFVTKNVITINQ